MKQHRINATEAELEMKLSNSCSISADLIDPNADIGIVSKLLTSFN